MAALTLAEARTIVGYHLDDDGTRWGNTEVDFALRSALSRCLNDYVAEGGDRFDTEASATTSASDGTVDLSAQVPLAIRGVSLLTIGSFYVPLKSTRREDRLVDDKAARTLKVRLVKELSLPTTTSHPLVGSGATAANTWDAFDNWVIARAALQLAVKDAELRQEMQALEADLRGSVLGKPRTPRHRPFTGPEAELAADLRWTWIPSTQTLHLTRVWPWA